MGMQEAWLIPALPAAAFVILLLFGKYLPRGGDWLSIAAITWNGLAEERRNTM